MASWHWNHIHVLEWFHTTKKLNRRGDEKGGNETENENTPSRRWQDLLCQSQTDVFKGALTLLKVNPPPPLSKNLLSRTPHWYQGLINHTSPLCFIIWPDPLPFVSGGWGPQTGSVYFRCPHCCHHSGRKAGSSCRHRWRGAGTAWRAPIGHWCPSSSSHWWSCCSWRTGSPSSPY